MDIPLVAQFIVCPRDDLLNVHIFQDEMVVTEEMYEQGEVDINFDEDEDFEYCDFFENSFLFGDTEQPLELEASRDNCRRTSSMISFNGTNEQIDNQRSLVISRPMIMR